LNPEGRTPVLVTAANPFGEIIDVSDLWRADGRKSACAQSRR
jgi:hypothetical protein